MGNMSDRGLGTIMHAVRRPSGLSGGMCVGMAHCCWSSRRCYTCKREDAAPGHCLKPEGPCVQDVNTLYNNAALGLLATVSGLSVFGAQRTIFQREATSGLNKCVPTLPAGPAADRPAGCHLGL